MDPPDLNNPAMFDPPDPIGLNILARFPNLEIELTGFELIPPLLNLSIMDDAALFGPDLAPP